MHQSTEIVTANEDVGAAFAGRRLDRLGIVFYPGHALLTAAQVEERVTAPTLLAVAASESGQVAIVPIILRRRIIETGVGRIQAVSAATIH